MNLVIRVTHKGERRIQRIELGQDPVVIGRGWNSDVLLDDNFVNAAHAELQLVDGQLTIRDLGSRNGTFVAGKSLSGAATPLQAGQTLILGDSQVQIFDASAPVPPTSLRTAWYLFLERFGNAASLAGFTALLVCLEVLSSWLTSAREFGLAEAAMSVGSLAVLVVFITTSMALLSKLLRNEFNFKAHWLILVITLIAYILLDFLFQIVRFNLQLPELSDTLGELMLSAIAVVFIVGFLSYATHLSPLKRFVWAFSLVLVTSVFNHSSEWAKEDYQLWNSYSNAESLTLPPAFLFRSTQSVEEYFDEADVLFEFSSEELASESDED